jgi:hypothetical protein
MSVSTFIEFKARITQQAGGFYVTKRQDSRLHCNKKLPHMLTTSCDSSFGQAAGQSCKTKHLASGDLKTPDF